MDIFASKLFRSSSRKDEIRSAAENPLNAELVKQITSYVDSEYKEYTAQGQKLKEEQAEEEFKEDMMPEEGNASEDDFGSDFHPSSIPHSSGANGHFDVPEGSDFDIPEDVPSDSGESESDLSDETGVVPEDEVSEAVDIVDESGSVFDPKDKDNIISSLKSILDGENATAGVARIQIKNNNSELWIYYNDRTNLNAIMEDVISAVSESKYSYLEFNRLARTDNAIVFSID